MHKTTMLVAFSLTVLTTPYVMAQQGSVAPFDMGGEATSPPRPQPPEPSLPTTETSAAPAALQRYLVPYPTLRLIGETDARSWVIQISGEQAGQASQLAIGYTNALMVMPEASRLRVSINGVQVLEQAIASAEKPTQIMADIPSGVLKPGPNIVRIQGAMYHRTDCSAEATYELWTDIVPAMTGLTFPGSGAPTLRGLDDIAAVGIDAEGRTQIQILAPSSNRVEIAPALLRLSQALALRGGFAHPVIKVVDDWSDLSPSGPGVLTVILATATELRNILPNPPPETLAGPSISYLDTFLPNTTAVLVTGRNWQEAGQAIQRIAAIADRPLDVSRTAMETASWQAPDAPFFNNERRVRFSDLGVPTQEFSGRLFRTGFAVGLPADFYANFYGEATVYLDAAYGSMVRAGSHVDVYVNGQLASTLTLTSDRGRIYRHYPIGIPLRHFQPGVNQITLEAVLDTPADAQCAPGATIPGEGRFVLLDSSEFEIPDLARIGQRPSLAALSGTAFPYGRAADPVAIVLGRHDPVTYSAAGTLLARMSMSSGRAFPIEPIASVSLASNRNALIVASTGQVPAGTWSTFAVSEDTPTSWRAPQVTDRPPELNDYSKVLDDYQRTKPDSEAPASNGGDTAAVADRWRRELDGGGGFSGQWTRFQNWLGATFDIQMQSLRLRHAPETVFSPPASASFLIVQASAPDGAHTWTLATSPDSNLLMSTANTITAPQLWDQVNGRLAYLEASAGRVRSEMPQSTEFVVTRDLSVTNARLIATNWMSANIIYYAIALTVLCIVLGGYTFSLLGRLGRKS